MVFVPSLRPRPRLLARRGGRGRRSRLLGLGPVAAEGPRRGELPEAVAHHVLREIHRDELLPVVHRHRVADELRSDHRAARPGLDDLLLAGAVERLDLVQQVLVDERSLARRTTHGSSRSPYFAFLRLTMNLSDGLRPRVFAPLVGLPHGVTGWRPPEVLPSPPPCGWSIGFIATPRLCGRRPSQRWRPALPIWTLLLSGFDTAPTVAMHSPRTTRS